MGVQKGRAGDHLESDRAETSGDLAGKQGNTVPRERMLEKIWQDGAEYVEENALSVAVSRLRAKVEEDPSKPRHILNVYGIRYVWK